MTAAQAPKLQARLNWSTETGFDHVILEDRTVGGDDWTTLPDLNGRTRSTVPTEYEAGYCWASAWSRSPPRPPATS